MAKPVLHPNWNRPAINMVDGYSIEITAKDAASLAAAAPGMPAETPVAVTFLPGEAMAARLAAIRSVVALGFEPMPHFSARRIESRDEFEAYLHGATQLGVRRCFVVAGDPSAAAGPFDDSAALIDSGAFEQAGIRAIGVGGHPDGHPHMNEAQCWQVLARKCAQVEQRGMAPLIVTQFSFDAAGVLAWLANLRARGIDAPVRVGVPGPAGIKTLLRFAARCGVGASASVLAKYGISVAHLLGTAGPDRLVDAFAVGLDERHGPVRLHFYPFGGLEKTVDWIRHYDRTH